ncbi:MAG: glycosyltransferase [Clostridiaceae bacterium]
MKKNKTLSIIVPVYNSEKYLGECLDTIINQRYTDLEIILIDDGSADRSREIIKDYMARDSRIKAFFQKNSGVSAARNSGIKNSTGDYITFVDSDDWLELNLYEEIIQKIEENNCDAGLYSYTRELKACVKMDEVLPFSSDELLDRERIHKDLILNLISYEDETKESIMGAIWRCVFKAELIKGNNILFDREMHYAEDLIFCLNAFKKCNSIYILNKPLYHYRLSGTSVTSEYKSDHFERQLFVYNKIKEVFKDNNDTALSNRMNIMMLRYIINGITHICNTNSSFSEKYRNVKRILNDKASEDIRKNYSIKSNKYKILKYNLPLTTFLLIDLVNKKSKRKLS